MENNYPFGGLAGETVRRFTTPKTVLTVLPAVVLTAVLGAIAVLLGMWFHLPGPLWTLVASILVSPIVGKSALAARDGDLESGFLSNWNGGELLGFAVRYWVLTLLSMLPLTWAANALTTNATALLLNPQTIASARGAMLVLAFLVLVAISVLAPGLILIVATRGQSVSECLSGEAWRWLLGRRGDLPTYYAAFLGGIAVFSALVIPVLLVLVALGFSARMEVGIAAAGLMWAVLVVAAGVLWGRLSGAFVLSDGGGPDQSTAHAAEPTSPDSTPIAPAAAHAPAAMDLAMAVKRLAATADAELSGAIAEAEALRAKAPDHAGLLAELAKLYLRANRTPEAIATASAALSRALSSGATMVAVACHDTFHAHRKSLSLKPAELEQLGKGLLEQNKIADAVWSFAASGHSGGEPIRVQKGLIASAEALNKAGQLSEAAKVYQYVIKLAPGSANAQYCEGALARINLRLRKASS